jgi:hypothetical protein
VGSEEEAGTEARPAVWKAPAGVVVMGAGGEERAELQRQQQQQQVEEEAAAAMEAAPAPAPLAAARVAIGRIPPRGSTWMR